MEESIYIKEIFALYGRALFIAQNIEKELATLLTGPYAIVSLEQIDKSRYEESLYENSQQTLGQLIRAIKNRGILQDILPDLQDIHQTRNWLVHNYYLERAVELTNEAGQVSLIHELKEINYKIYALFSRISDISDSHLKKINVDLYPIAEELMRKGKTPPKKKFRELTKQEILIGVYEQEINEGEFRAIFELQDNGFWTLCEVGLSSIQEEIDKTKIRDIPKIQELLPIKQFNPRPKGAKNWNYDLILKSGYAIAVRPKGSFSYRWGLKKLE